MNKVILIIVVLLGCCIACGGIVFGLFGHLEINGQCTYKGPLSAASEGACKTTNEQIGVTTESNYTGTYSNEIGLTIPETYFLDEEETDISFIYSKDPTTVSQGDFIPNLNFIKSTDIGAEFLQLNESLCQDFLDLSIEQLREYYDSITNTSSGMKNLNGIDICVVKWDAVLNGIDLVQEQYVIPVEAGDSMFYITLTTNKELEEFETLRDIAGSFQLK